MNAIKKVIKYVTKVENVVMVAAFVLMVVCYFISVINRNLIKASMPWTEELSVYSMVYLALIGMELGLRDGTQVSVTALTSKLNGKVKKIVGVISHIVLIVFLFMMLYYGVALVEKQITTGQTSPVLKLPMSALYFSLVISFGISFIVQCILLVCNLLNINTDEITGLNSTKKEEVEA